MNKRLFLYYLSATAAVLPFVAQAQYVPEDERVINVTEKNLPEYRPDGIRAGLFQVLPFFAVEENYDDNIYRTSGSKESDFITRVRPGTLVQSDWNNHQIQLSALGDFGFYADNSSEDYQDYVVQAKGRLDIVRDTYLHGLVRHNHIHEERDSPNDAGGDEPTEIDINTAQVGFVRERGRIKLYASAQVKELEFEDTFAGPTVIDNDDRNRVQQEYEAKVAYELHPQYDVFVRYITDMRDYDNTALVNRDSTGQKVEMGGTIDISGKAKGEVYAGYLEQDYDTFGTLNKANFGGCLLYTSPSPRDRTRSRMPSSA